MYAKLATAFAETLSPLPSLHGEHVPVLNVLYPLLLAPLYGMLDPPDAFRAAHTLNGVVIATAAIPAYLLARQVLARAWALAVAAVSIALPWIVLGGFLMSEVVAYPAFLWAVLAVQRSLAEPSVRSDALALAALVVAVLARVQFAALAVVVPLVVVLHEAGYAVATAPVRRRVALRDGFAAALARHRVLAVFYAAAAAVAAALAARGALGRSVGTYAAATEGPLLPDGLWRAAAVHLDVVAVGVGVAPLLLGAAWAATTCIRPSAKREHALAVLSVVLVAALSLQVASFDLRFGGPDVVRDRYLFYVAPLLLICATAGALQGRARWVAVPAAAAFFAVTVRDHAFATFRGVHADTPASVLNDGLLAQAGSLSPQTFVAVGGLLLGVLLAAATAVLPGRVVAGALLALVLVFSAATARHAFERVFASPGLSGRPMLGAEGVVLQWVDAMLPRRAAAAILPYPTAESPEPLWWDVEFWNRTVKRAFVDARGRYSYTPFPTDALRVDFRTGSVTTPTDAPRYVVVAENESRFRLAGPRLGANLGLEIVDAQVPYRADWATRGAGAGGSIRPRTPVTVRVFSRPGEPATSVALELVLTAPVGTAPGYRVDAGTSRREGRIPGGATETVQLELCVPGGGFADAVLVSERAGAASAAGILAIQTTRTEEGCIR